ncbi:MAG: ABC transporter ATP-binding protein [Candidatus Magasanikbacteria bacterium]|nr:ABC transporter ATP-binding protein [Candidatus Magasanikbacteria bacterium]
MLELKNISFRYREGDKLILDQLSFKIDQGEIVSLIGPTGIGKTTLVNIIAGYLKQTSGEVLIQGKVVNKPGRNRIVISQENDLFPWMNVFDQLFFVQKNVERVEELINLVGLSDSRNKFPHELSGGMKKRLSFARALALDADFIIMDEPFSSQDVKMRARLYEDLLQIAKQDRKTIFLITHNLEEAVLLSNRILVLGRQPARIVDEYRISFSQDRTCLDEEGLALKRRLEELGYNI